MAAELEVVLKQLTIAVPSYNVEKTLEATLSSLCVSEVLPELDIIVVDDGSKDGTAKIAEGFACRYPESVCVIRKENGGHGSAVNTGIDAAQGRYFKVVDGDDRLDRDGLSGHGFSGRRFWRGFLAGFGHAYTGRELVF